MTSHPSGAELMQHDVPTPAVTIFFLLTFAITWGIVSGYILFPETTADVFGELQGAHPLFFVATWGPAISGVIMIVRHSGIGGLRRFLSRIFLWRAPLMWWLLIIIGFPLIFMAGSAFKGGPLLAPTPEEGVGTFFVIMVIMLFLGPIEEFGWRGVAQPLLQRLISPFWAGAVIGMIWGVWHLPAFHLSGVVFADWDFTTFFIGSAALGILVTPIFNDARGSLLLPMLFHWQLIIPFWPDAQPWDTWIIVVLTAIVVWIRRKDMFSRDGAVTEVVPVRA